jgi:16S rRNA (guanine966-N2)-methyltransferase
MRVIAGEAGSIRLLTPKGTRLRPTSDAVRESLFSSLGPDVAGLRFLDAYAGTGAVGIEALSRGAAECVFIERDRHCVEAIRRNLANTRLTSRATIVAGDAKRLIDRVLAAHGPFDLAFVDPPYTDREAVSVARRVLEAGLTPEAGRLIYQHSKDAPPEGLPEPDRTRAFGETVLSWYRSGKGGGEDGGE